MRVARYLALLRGINVGGNNVIRMTDLRSCFEGLGLRDVTTYIQSGNVVFVCDDADEAKLVRRIEEGLADGFGLRDCVVLLDRQSLERIVREAPRGFGTSPEEFRYDVIFLRKPMTPSEAIKQVRARPGVDAVHAGSRALYFSRLSSMASRSQLSKLTQLPVYKFMTIRNWNTTTKLLEMMR